MVRGDAPAFAARSDDLLYVRFSAATNVVPVSVGILAKALASRRSVSECGGWPAADNVIQAEAHGVDVNEHRMEFTESENPWALTAAVAEINERTGSELELVGLDEQSGGTSSAAYVRWPDGRECALTRTDIPMGWMRRTADILSMLRAEGLPVPRHDLVIAFSDGRLAVVQERLPGRLLNRVDARDIDAMFVANEQFAGILANRRDIPHLPHVLQFGPDDQVRLHLIETYSVRSRLLLGRIQEIIRTTPQAVPGHGLVHPDYGLGNILFDECGEVTGIVDWNGGAMYGDHHFPSEAEYQYCSGG